MNPTEEMWKWHDEAVYAALLYPNSEPDAMISAGIRFFMMRLLEQKEHSENA